MSNFHESLKREEEVVGSSNRNFGLLFAAIAAGVAGVHWYLDHGHALEWSAVAAVLLVISLFFSGLLTPFNRAWTKLGLLMFHVINPVVMFIMYITTIVPIGLIMRALRKDLLKLHYAPKAETYWVRRDPAGPARDTMPLQF